MNNFGDAMTTVTESSFGENLRRELQKLTNRARTPRPQPPAAPNDDAFSLRLTQALRTTDPKTQATSSTGTDELKSGSAKPSNEAAKPVSAGPVGGGERVVKQGECISSIARDSGHFWQTLWDEPANAELRGIRVDPNVLLPGDRVHVPPLREKWEAGQTEKRHRFQRRGEPAVLRLTLQVDDVALANEPYTLEIDGQSLEGTTDAEGKLERAIPSNARRGRLIVGAERWEFVLELGHIDPVENLAGVQKRLINLGFYCERQDGEWDQRCADALRSFQKRYALAETGEPDDATRSKLKEVHGA